MMAQAAPVCAAAVYDYHFMSWGFQVEQILYGLLDLLLLVQSLHVQPGGLGR